jgi:hypothetical protein
MSYTPDPDDATNPVDSVFAETATAEFRSLKEKMNAIIGAYNSGTPTYTLSSMSATITSNYNSLNTSIGNLTTTVNNNYTTLNSGLTTANTNISTNASNISTNTTNIGTNTTNIATNASGISTLNGDISTINSTLATLETKDTVADVTANTTLTLANRFAVITATSTITVTLPSAVTGNAGYHISIFNDSSYTQNITCASNIGVYFASGFSWVTSLTLAPGESITFEAQTDGHWIKLGGNKVAAILGGFYKEIKNKVLTSTTASISVAAISMTDSSGDVTFGTISLTLNTATSGAGGLDTGSLAAGFYNIFALSNGSTTSACISTGSAPDAGVLASYPYYARIGSLLVNSSLQLVATYQVDDEVQYVVGGPNLSALPTMASGVHGSVTVPTYIGVSVTPFIPISASRIVLVASNQGATGSAMLLAPNANYGAYNSAGNSPPIVLLSGTTNNPIVVPCELLLESDNVYLALQSSACLVQCLGWKETF